MRPARAPATQLGREAKRSPDHAVLVCGASMLPAMAHTSTWLGSARWAKMQLTQSYSFERTPMDSNLFTDRSIWTMLHGIVLGGGALLGLSAALFALVTMRAPPVEDASPERQGRDIGWLTTFVAIALWLTVIVGTYVSFPPYRATPPGGLVDLTRYPRSFLLANPGTAWLHSFAMEIKEHVPWIAAMMSTSVAFVCVRHPSRLLHDAAVRRIAVTLLATCFVLVAVVSLLGVFINKVAPLD